MNLNKIRVFLRGGGGGTGHPKQKIRPSDQPKGPLS